MIDTRGRFETTRIVSVLLIVECNKCGELLPVAPPQHSAEPQSGRGHSFVILD